VSLSGFGATPQGGLLVLRFFSEELGVNASQLAFAMLAVQPILAGGVEAAPYCRTYGAQCAEEKPTIERGRKGRVSFVLRPDGSGCIGPSAKYLDCSAEQPTPRAADDWRPWYVSCVKDEAQRRCTATDTYGFKISVDTRNGWRIGVGHNNYLDSPVRISAGKMTNEYKNSDGWLSNERFAPAYQLLIRKTGVSVEFVVENFVKLGPKWNPAGAPGPILEDVFGYLEWAIKNKGHRPAAAPVRTSEALEMPQLSVLDCYSVQLGAPLGTVLAELGRPAHIRNDFVGSDGVETAELQWHPRDGICATTVRAGVVTKTEVRDAAALDAFMGRKRKQ
jgi:hypothetical protein